LPLPHSSVGKGHCISAQTGWLGATSTPLRFGGSPREQRNCASQPAQSEGDDRGNDGSSFHRVTDRDRMRRCS
jgi:hypothetical protein